MKVPGGKIFYDLYRSQESNKNPPVLYLPSLNRPKNEAKSNNLQTWCRRNDITFLCADYFGLGRSSGTFAEGSVGRWAEDTVTIIENVLSLPVQKKVVLVGHGVGAWVSFVVAQKRPDLVAGIVGLAADPDFTEELLWKKLSDDVKAKIMNEGVATITWGSTEYPISRTLIEDGRKNLLLQNGPSSLPIFCPVRLIHGLADEEVPYQLALQLAENCKTSDASVILLKGSSHYMESEKDMLTMRSMIVEVIEAFKEAGFDLTSPGSG